MMGLTDFNLTPKAKKCIKDARAFAESNNHKLINASHLIYGCLANLSDSCIVKLKSFGFNPDLKDFKKLFKEFCKAREDIYSTDEEGWHEEVNEVIFFAKDFSDNFDSYFIGVEHILYVTFDMDGEFVKFLKQKGVDVQYGKDIIESHVIETSIPSTDQVKNIFHIEGKKLSSSEKSSDKKNFKGMEILEKYCTNLNHKFITEESATISCRDYEINELIEILLKKNKSNAILIGEAGVGKTAIVEGLAQKIVNQQVPCYLSLMQIYSVDITSMLAGTKYRGEFEQRFKQLINEVSKDDNIILFIDEIHTIIGAGSSEGGVDASNMLKPALARGNVKCIGATTFQEYKKFFEKDSAIKRRFDKIIVDQPSKADTKTIVLNAIEFYESFHHVKYEDKEIDLILDLCETFLSNKNFPDKAFDIVDQVGAKTKIKYFKGSEKILKARETFTGMIKNLDENNSDLDEELFTDIIKNYITTMSEHMSPKGRKRKIKEKDIIEVVSEKSGIPSKAIIKKKNIFSKFMENMKSEIFGQDKALEKIYSNLSCAQTGLSENNKPLSSFLFVGSTGVGKTFSAKNIAKFFFGNEKSYIQLNMGEYQDKTSINKLIGANAGYIGYEEGGILSEHVRNNPNCVVVFDEIEKCEPKILDVLLHLLDEGYVTDNLNRKIDFNNTIVVMTSNIGHQRKQKRSMGFVEVSENPEDVYNESLKKELRPELISRIDEIIVFEDLQDTVYLSIISKEIRKLKERLSSKNIELKLSPYVKKFIFNEIKNKKIHARDVKSFVKKFVQFPISKYIINNRDIEKVELKIKNKSICCL
jgi:ATP-dependent Clp protease ATP-binding subunit ClpC